MLIEVSVGEVLDKLSILSIKLNKITDTDKLRNVAREMSAISKHVPSEMLEDPLYQKLCGVNMRLWELEDEIRVCEKHGDFHNNFIRIARAVYLRNDERAAIKKEINIKYNSDLVEEKSYQEY